MGAYAARNMGPSDEQAGHGTTGGGRGAGGGGDEDDSNSLNIYNSSAR